jgi:hypothetical protein
MTFDAEAWRRADKRRKAQAGTMHELYTLYNGGLQPTSSELEAWWARTRDLHRQVAERSATRGWSDEIAD